MTSKYGGRIQVLRRRLSKNSKITPLSPTSDIRNAILGDQYLRGTHEDIYRELMAACDSRRGPIIEIGAGSGVSKEWLTEVITTDVVTGDGIDEYLDATKMPYADDSIGGFILKDSLHHIPDVLLFFNEAKRCLVPGGKIMISDPYWGPLSSFIYRYFHPEPFNPKSTSWSFSSDSPWDSNQALLWILFRRDRAQFEIKLPESTIVEHGPRIGASYLLSGGVFGRTPINASFLTRFYRWEERQGRWYNVFRFEYIIELSKTE
jgi:SAM-dependent methyltransferase